MTLISTQELEQKFIREVLEQKDKWPERACYNTYSMAAGFAMGHGYKQGKAYMFAKSLEDRNIVC